MPLIPKLSICVPSRNRQRYFQETIRSLTMNLRTDIEFIFADNSSDPSIMNDFIGTVAGDPRVRFLPAGERVVAMPDNWERCMAAARGEWVCFIGDDDFVDPDVVDLILRVEQQNPAVDAISWTRIDYYWPGARRLHGNVTAPLGTRVEDVPREQLMRALFIWENANVVPICPFSVYHGAVRRQAMETIKTRFGGRFFEHLTVDYETTAKLLVTAGPIVYCQRPFSILGACAESNSATIGNTGRVKKSLDDTRRELGRNIDDDPYMQGFPFPNSLGVSAAVAQLLRWFGHTYGYEFTGWEERFAMACADNCLISKDQESYDITFAGYQEAFSRWHDGRYLPFFDPGRRKIGYDGDKQQNFFTGVHDNTLHLDTDVGGAQTPGELYAICKMALVRAEELDVKVTLHDRGRDVQIQKLRFG